MTDYSSEDFWKGAPEGATHYFAPFFYKTEGLRAWLFDDKWELSSYSTPQINERGIKRPAPPWSGDGRPPVGTVCEWRPNQDGWVRVEILGHSGEETWFRRDGNSLSETCLRMAFFRPIKTPAQIAAEEREAAVKAMRAIVNNTYPAECPYLSLYDAGYRLTKGGGD